MVPVKITSSEGRCDVCQTVTSIKLVSDGKKEVSVCAACAGKMASTLEELLIQYGHGEETMETSVDKFLVLVKEKKKLTLEEAATILKEKQSTMEKWAELLDRRGLIKLVYPENPFEKPYVQVKD